ncbi:hypothetical protein [Actinacidiphila rubida]|uniref:Secreted protein n=1 Tax=Actinacidiphila rubida TaxID=310780 RepID=A0A1H8TB69_9ACTN|nr:hypothetical protein [Actinacidiphila rubida]SEO88142.1 hypothetical protein SAMN05216267_105028 [Actinacidiphila rubida]
MSWPGAWVSVVMVMAAIAADAVAGGSLARESNAVLVEEYLDGPEVGVETVSFACGPPGGGDPQVPRGLSYFEETGHTVAASDPAARGGRAGRRRHVPRAGPAFDGSLSAPVFDCQESARGPH